MEDRKEVFGPNDVVFTYSDADALRDGVLIAISAVHRATRAVWDYVYDECTDRTLEEPKRLNSTRAQITSLVNSLESIAKEIWDKNIDGGIATTMHFGKKMWLIPNENDGMTLMFPEDY